MSESELDVAIRAVGRAAVLCHKIRSEKRIWSMTKSDGSPVTNADYGSQALIVKTLRDRFPHDPIMAEETATPADFQAHHDFTASLLADLNASQTLFLTVDALAQAINRAETPGAEPPANWRDRYWVIDPIDGTVNFSKGIPFFSISIALVIDQKVQVGVVYHVMQDEMFVAQKGHGAYLNGKSLHVSKTNTIKRAILATGFPYNLIENPNHCIEHFIEILKLGVPIRRMGSAAIDLCYIAAGRFDGFWEISLRPWDFAAAWLIVEEAKGKVTDMDGNPLNPFKTSSVLAANLDIHPSLIEHLKLRN